MRKKDAVTVTFIRIVCQRKYPIDTRVIVSTNIKINPTKNTFGIIGSRFSGAGRFFGTLRREYL